MLTVYVVHGDSSCLLHGCLFIANVWQVEIFQIADKYEFKPGKRKQKQSSSHNVPRDNVPAFWLGLAQARGREDRSSDLEYVSFLLQLNSDTAQEPVLPFARV